MWRFCLDRQIWPALASKWTPCWTRRKQELKKSLYKTHSSVYAQKRHVVGLTYHSTSCTPNLEGNGSKMIFLTNFAFYGSISTHNYIAWRKWVKASHTLVRLYLKNILANFHQNPTNLHALLICLNRGKSSKNKPWVFRLQRNSQFLHFIIKGHVNAVTLPTNEMPYRNP